MTVLDEGGAVALPSRGLVHSRTIESILKATDYRWPLFFSHDLPIPDAQNEVVEVALAEASAEWLLLVEEDNTVPGDLLTTLANSRDNVQVLDYALEGGNRAVISDGLDGVLHAGIGCMLVRQSVFAKLSQPWFDTQTFTRAENPDGRLELVGPFPERSRYADVYFYWNLAQAGERIVQLPGEAGHWKVGRCRDDGPHDIRRL